MKKKKSERNNNTKNNSNDFCDILSIPSNPEDYFTLLYPIRREESGNIYKAIHNKTNKIYAVKIIDFSQYNKNDNVFDIFLSIKKETLFMKSMNDTNYFLKYYGSYFSRKSNTLWLILEYCFSGSLIDIMSSMGRTFSEVEVATIIEMVLHGLMLIHNNNLIHSDIKGGNIFLSDDGYARINTFGIGEKISPEKYNRIKKDSSYWISPEIASNSNYDFKTDIWSLGITCIELIEGEPPFSELSPKNVIERIANKKLNYNNINYLNEHTYEFNNFIEHCLEIDQKKRFTTQELIEHEFVKKFSKGRQYLINLIKKYEVDIGNYRFNSEKEYQRKMRNYNKNKVENQVNDNGMNNIIDNSKELVNSIKEYSESVIINDEKNSNQSERNEKYYEISSKKISEYTIDNNEDNNLYDIFKNENFQIDSLTSSIDIFSQKSLKENFINEQNNRIYCPSKIKERKNIDCDNIYLSKNIDEIKYNRNNIPINSTFHANNLSDINNNNNI